MRDFRTFVKRFGIIEGCTLFLRFRYAKTNDLHLSELKHPLYVRPNTLDNASFEEIFLDGEYDIPYPAFSSQPIQILDAGANTGFASIFYANKFPDSKIIAVEPEAENSIQLRLNVEQYSMVSAVEGAIWKEDTRLNLKDDGWGTRGYMMEETIENLDGLVNAYSIETIKRMFEWNHIDILKMDVEGSEKEIFESNYEFWIPRTHCLIIETHDRMKPGCSESLLTTMKKFDFNSFAQGENLIFVNQNMKIS